MNGKQHRTTLTITNYDKWNKIKQFNTHVPNSTTFTTNIEVHGSHQAWTRVTVQLPQLDLAAGAGLWRKGLERQEG